MRCLSCIIFLLICSVNIFAQSPHGNLLKIDCANCHESTNWKIIPKNIKFDHNTETSFKLSGQHASVSCQSCHTSLVFSKVESQCVSCHKDVHQKSLGTNCVQCHTTDSWIVVNIIQIHQNSRFPLMGVHLNVDCQSCHSGYANLYFPAQSVSCYSCHKQQYLATTAPNHIQANFSTDCQTCHSLTDFAWASTTFDHSFFPLVGGHNIQNCFACHAPGSNFKGLTTDCYSCHQQNYLTAKNPDHVAANFSTNCVECHNSISFTTLIASAKFNHNDTGFPLTGQHANLQCAQCHSAGYTNTPTACVSCHLKDYNTATSPVNHVAAGLPQTCQDCHNTTVFTTTTFNHTTTGFTLTGFHTTVSCESCHKGSVAGTPTDCYSCHTADYAGTTNPNHAAQGFSHDCSQCHTTTDWNGASVDHAALGFPLTGQHANLQCAQCHTSGYTNTSTACVSCHLANYNSAISPVNHAAAGLPQTCGDCHSIAAPFTTTTFDHATTSFALTGAHTTVSCESCHKGSVVGTPTDCYSCHAAQYNGTTDPNHAAQGFSHDCSQCHSTTSFGDASFNHNNTGFPLTGAHTTVTCQACHNSNYTNTPTACVSCHLANYNSATTPVNHAAAGLPQTCGDCHTTTDFTTTTFNHATTGFALTGAHTTVSCESCHKGSVVGTPTDCYSCHAAQYNGTTDPNHAAQGFSHDCSQCHSTTSFGDASFNHNNTGFPLTGAHTTVTCQACHNSNYTNTPTDCYTCHTTDYNSTTNPAHQASGFPTTCVQCHTTTAWTPSTFNHTTFFPLTGNHNTACANCHQTVSNFAIHSCNAVCHKDAHHQNEDCYTCHPTGQGG